MCTIFCKRKKQDDSLPSLFLFASSLFLLFFISFRDANAQHVEINFIATDTLADSRLLTIGLDPVATDNIDAGLGEFVLGPVSSNYEARIIGDDIGKPALGAGVLRDFRGIPGFQPFSIQYELLLKPRTPGTTVTLQWSFPLPSGIIDARLRDVANVAYNVDMASTSFVQIRGGTQKVIITLTFSGLPSSSRYTLTTLDVPIGKGITSKTSNLPAYASGQTVILTATPIAGYEFISWIGDTTVPNSAALNVVMWKNKTIAAVYEALPPPTCTFTTSVTPVPSAGGINLFPVKSTYDCGELVQLTAQPSNCWRFSRWSGDTVSTDPVMNVLLWKNRNIVAEYVPNPPILDVSSQPAIGGLVIKTPDFPTYACNSSVLLTAVANPGYRFVGWEGDTIMLGQQFINVTMNKSKRIVARFCEIASGSCGPVITVRTNPPGLQFTVDGITYTNSHIFIWQLGERHEIGVPFAMQTQFLPNSQWSRYRFKNWTPAQSQPVFDYSVLTQSANFTAEFTAQHALVVENVPANGGQVSISPPSPDGFYDQGTNVLLNAFANSGWKFKNWTGDIADTINPRSVTIDAPKRIQANYLSNINPITTAITIVTTPPNLTVVVDNKIYSTPVTFRWVTSEEHEISVPPGFQLQFPSGGGSSAGTRYLFLNWDDGKPATHKILVTNTDKTYRANFQTQHQLKASVVPLDGGSINVSPSSADGFYDYSTLVSLRANENSAYRFDQWTGDVTGNRTAQDIQIVMDAPKNVVAQFVLKSKDAVPVNVTSAPPGLSLVIDGSTMTTPIVINWIPGEQHEISVPTSFQQQYLPSSSRTRYQFDRWSDAGAAAHKITVNATGNQYTAFFKTYHQLTVEPSPANGGSIVKAPDDPEGFYPEGSIIQLSANPNIGWKFLRWNSVDSLDVLNKVISTTLWKSKTLRAFFEYIGAARLCVNTTNVLLESCLSEEELPALQIFHLQNCGFESMKWTTAITYLDTARAWLRVVPDSGTLAASGIVTLGLQVVNRVGVGDHPAEITITAPNADNSPLKIRVLYRVKPKPHFEVNPTQLKFSAKQFDPQLPAAQTFMLVDYSSCPVQWTVKADTPWVDISQTGGSVNSASVAVRMLRNDLPIGIHRTRVRIESFQADNSPIFIPIEYEIRGAFPDAPDSLTAAKVDDQSIYLQWKDYAYNEDGFYIERHNETTKLWERIGKVDRNEASYLDKSLEACKKYTYRIQAYNESGVSPYSNEASATTCRARGVLTNQTAFIYPNPITLRSTFSFTLSQSADVTIRVVDASNTVVKIFTVPAVQADDCNNSVSWDGANDRGELLANGVYFFIIETTAGERAVGKIALLK